MMYPENPGSKGSAETSAEAAASIDCARLQRMTLRAIREAKQHGRTAEEAAQRLDLPRVSIGPRTSELKAMGLINGSGKRRINASSGKSAVVWVAKEYLA